MKSLKIALVLGFISWLIPFVIAIIIYPIHELNRPLFESIMPVTISATLVTLMYFYFRKVEKNYLKEGLILGIIWFVINITIDLFMFSTGPMAMPLLDYIADIGVTYLMIPIITIGFGYIINKIKFSPL
jgi:hypothetical protein